MRPAVRGKCNEAFAGLFGYGRAELIDTSFSRLYPVIADFVRTGEMWRHNLAGTALYYDERVMAGAGGRRFWRRVNGRARNAADPLAAALYCFEPMSRPVSETSLKLTGRQRQIMTLVTQASPMPSSPVKLGCRRGPSRLTAYGSPVRRGSPMPRNWWPGSWRCRPRP